MNKVYRVVWNARLGVCIAISELTKSTPKNTQAIFTSAYSVPDASSKNLLVSTFFFTSRLLPSLVGLIMGTSILLSTTQAIAAPGMDSLAAGVGAEPTGVQSLAAGVNALSSGERSLAAGVGAVSSGGNSLAAGVDAISSGNFSLAVGSGVESAGTTSVAIGFGSESKAASSLAIGQFSQSLGDSSIAVGSAAVSSGASSIAIGQFSQATADNSVALGQGSIADGSTLSTAAYQPLDADGNAIPISLGTATSEVNIGDRRMTGVAAGATDTDAVNVSQLKAVNTSLTANTNNISTAQNQINQGLILSFNGDARTYQLGGTIGLTTDSNILTTTTTDGANFALNPNINLGAAGSVTTGAMIIDNNGLTITGGPSVTTSGINANNSIITQVKAGDVSAASKDAINGSQLYSLGNNVTNIFGGNAEYANNTISWNNIGGTGQNTIDKSIEYINKQAANANQGWTVTTDTGNDATSTIKPGDNLNIKGDAVSGVTVTNNSNDISIGLGSQVTIGNGSNAVVINGDDSAINVGNINIDGVAGNLTAGQVAVNGKEGTVNGLTNTTWNPNSIVSGQAATEDQLQQIVRDAATAAKSKVSAGSNMTVTPTQNSDGSYDYQVATKKDVSFDSVQVGNVSINASGINAGDKKVGNVSNGAINSTSKDAVNGSQLYTNNTDIYSYFGGGANYDTNTGPTYAVNGGSQSNVGDALNALDNRDNQLDNKITNLGDQFQQISYVTNERIDNVEKNANAGIAAAIALETAPYIAGKYTYAAAAAYHGGENALGISLRKTADNGRWSLTGGIAAASQGDPSVRIGISGVID